MIQPIGSRLIVSVKAAEEKTAGGIVLPTMKNQTQQVGTVKAIGTGRILENGKHLESEFKCDDEVIFAKFAGTQVQYEGQNYFIIDERDILAKVSR